MSTMGRGHFHETRAVFKSAARLRAANFVVGVTDAYDSFVVLLALELGESRVSRAVSPSPRVRYNYQRATLV